MDRPDAIGGNGLSGSDAEEPGQHLDESGGKQLVRRVRLWDSRAIGRVSRGGRYGVGWEGS
jgi:hypothetical protein